MQVVPAWHAGVQGKTISYGELPELHTEWRCSLSSISAPCNGITSARVRQMTLMCLWTLCFFVESICSRMAGLFRSVVSVRSLPACTCVFSAARVACSAGLHPLTSSMGPRTRVAQDQEAPV